MRGRIIFPPFWCLIHKLDRNSGLDVKNQREISGSKVKRLYRPFAGEKWGEMRERGGNGIRTGGNALKVQN